ncbi:MAG: hypothetical protein WB755_14180 [Terriglobales bacterium]
MQNLLHKAEAAHQEGDLDIAKKMVEETLELAPNDLQAKALFRVIHRDWAERSRQTKVESLVESARKEIASRRFTAALDVLKEAEALDPSAPNVKSLIESASAGREQERLRKELEAINLQIEEALDKDDFVTACQIIDQALVRFPEDRSLLKLRSLAEKQRQVSERKQFIDQQLTQARALIQAGRNEEVLQLLEAALKKVGSDPHLHSLQVIVRETVERERTEKRKAEFLQRARECLRRKEFAEAIDTLNAASAEFQQDADVAELLQFAKDEAAVDERKRVTEAVVEKARALIENDEYDQAVQLLEAELPEGAEEELGIALSQARHAATEYQKRLDGALSASRKLLQNRKAAEAMKLLESQPASFRRNSDYNELLQQARRDAERWHNIESAVERARQLSGQRNFDEAFRALEECRGSWGDAPELQIAATEVESHRSADATEKLELVMADGRMLMMAKEYRAVIDRLKPAASLASVASAKLRNEFETLKAQATKALVLQRRAQIEALLRKGEHREASDLLSGSQTEFPDNRTLDDLQKRLDDAVARRTEVQNLLHTARRLFGESSWKQGGEACVRAISLAALDPWLREQAIEVALRAADSALEKDWRSADTLVQDLTEVRAGTAVPASLRSRIAEKKRGQEIQDAVSEVRGLQSSGNLSGALELVGKHLAAFADDPSLKALQAELQQQQRDQDERARLEQERLRRLEHLKTIREQLEREPAPEAKIRILEEALRTYPDEAPLQQQLESLRDLTQRVAARAQQAKELEESRQYAQAIHVWKEIKGLDPRFSATEASLERLRGLQRQELEARKVALMGQAQEFLAAHDLEAAAELLAQAKSEFPDDPQVAELEKSIEERASTRTRALNLIAEGRRLVEKKKWDKGAESLQKAAEVGSADLPVRQEALSALLQAAESATSLDLRSAESVVDLAARLDPSSSELAKIRANLENRKREAAVAQCLAASQRLEAAGDLNGALSQLDPGLLAYPDEPQLLQRKQALEAQLRAAEAARQREKQIVEHEQSAQRLHSAGDLQGSLTRVKQGLTEFPGEPRLLRLKTVVDKSITEAEELKRREEERKRQEEERKRQEEQRRHQEEQRKKEEEELQRVREETAAREAERRKQEEAERLRLEQVRKREEEAAREAERQKREEAEKLRLEQVRKREEEAAREVERRKQEEAEKSRLEQARKREEKAAREAEKKKKREDAEKLRLEQARQRKEEAQRKAEARKLRESLPAPALAASEATQAGPIPLWKRPATAAIGVLVALVMVWGAVHFLSTTTQEKTTGITASKTGSVSPNVNPLELQQRQALGEADKKRAAGDLAGATRVLQDAAALNGPLTGDVQKMQDAIQAETKNDQLRKLRQQEARWWQEATSDVDRGQFRTAQKDLNDILKLPEGGLRRDDAEKYLRQVIPQRIHEEALFAEAKQGLQKNDQTSLTNAAGLLDQVIGLDGPRKPEAEQLRQQIGNKLAGLATQQQQKQQQIADLEAGAQRDIAQGDLSSARQKVDLIKQAGGDPGSLTAGIAQAEKLEQSRQQYENAYQQAVQKYQQSAGANDKKGLEGARASLQAIAQGSGSHAADARGYLNQIDAKLADINQPPPPPVVKPEEPSARALDEIAIQSVIKKYEQAFDQKSADALREIWPSIGKRYGRYKDSFDQASAFHVQVRIENMAIGQNGQATVNALMSVDYTPKRGNTPVPHREDRAVFELTKSNGNWVISDVK